MFTLKQLKPKIWHLHFESGYDLTLHFCRYQEYYENPEMKGENIQLVDIMEYYSKRLGKGLFTYPKDWAGFNLPGPTVFHRHRSGISDPNRYDSMMLSFVEFIRAKEMSENFYIIGTSEDDTWKNMTFNHELAHGLFYSDEIYAQKMTLIVNELPAKVKNKIFSTLKKWGYDESVFIDEAQAYMSTGLQSPLECEMIEEHQSKFIKVFNQYSKGIRKKPEEEDK